MPTPAVHAATKHDRYEAERRLGAALRYLEGREVSDCEIDIIERLCQHAIAWLRGTP